MKSLLTCVFVLSCTGYVTGMTTRTEGQSGEICGATKCLYGEAYCDQEKGRCVCFKPTFASGWGEFACYESGTVCSEIKNDPRVKMLYGARAGLPMSCRYLLTHVKLKYKVGSDAQGSCNMLIFGWNEKSKGKYFLGGIDIAIEYLAYKGHKDGPKASIRLSGIAKSGKYTYRHSGAEEFLPDGVLSTHKEKGCRSYPELGIDCYFDTINNVVKITSAKCGFRLTFRAFDEEIGKDQPMVPGLSVAFYEDHSPRFVSTNDAIALQPTGLTLDDLSFQEFSDAQKITMRALVSNVPQTQPNAAVDECMDPGVFLSFCPDDEHRVFAFQQCWPLLTKPLVVSCLDGSKNGKNVLHVHEKCIKYFCVDYVLYSLHKHEQFRCTYLRHKLLETINKDKSCDRKFRESPEIVSILEGTVC